MGEAKRRKKLDPNWGKAPKRPKLEIVVLEGREEEYDQKFPPVPESVIDYFGGDSHVVKKDRSLIY